MKRDLVFERIYPHPPSKVWEALADSKAIAEWLMENDFEPKVGHKFQFHTKPVPMFDFNGVVDCEVLEVDAPHRLVYSWQSGPLGRTIVAWTLEPVAEGTRLKLEHNGFEGARGVAVSIMLGNGWKSILRKKLFNYIAAM